MPVSSQVYVLYTAMLLLLAAAKRCPPLLKQQSLHAFIWNSASCLHAASVRLRHPSWASGYSIYPNLSLVFMLTPTNSNQMCADCHP